MTDREKVKAIENYEKALLNLLAHVRGVTVERSGPRLSQYRLGPFVVRRSGSLFPLEYYATEGWTAPRFDRTGSVAR